MPPALPSTGLTITNPLVLYRTLLATKRLEPDPAQHRLAIHLQKLYFRLKDYSPRTDLRYRIDQLRASALQQQNEDVESKELSARRGGLFQKMQRQTERNEILALTRKLTDHESAIKIDSPQGLLLHGEVGTGKSLLVDLLADSLPNYKKKRWHFNTFMLQILTKLEHLRKSRLAGSISEQESGRLSDEHSLLWLARDIVATSPILFLDEFQLPDRAASKILSNLLTSFFHLGGVMVATSNRMPEELANASGTEFSPSPPKSGLLGSRWDFFRPKNHDHSKNMFSSKSDFTAFLDVLRARCEIWDMEGKRDWRRRETENDASGLEASYATSNDNDRGFDGLEPMSKGNIGLGYEQSIPTEDSAVSGQTTQGRTPPNYFVMPTLIGEAEVKQDKERWEVLESALINPPKLGSQRSSKGVVEWSKMVLRIYGRELLVPRQLSGITKWSFHELCSTNLGPADYITLAATFHTFILYEVPILTLLQKNEARRFITLLDALYEARCKLLISAEAGPDDIFFPEAPKRSLDESQDLPMNDEAGDNVYSETFSEIYQDASAPFRPNISSYSSVSASPPNYAPTTPSPFSNTRSVLADEDSDFGPVYGAGRGSGITDTAFETKDFHPDKARQPDFGNTGAYTGEDERFAYKRARSRLWEMCGTRWWAREGDDWWRPVSRESRTWESDSSEAALSQKVASEEEREKPFRHGASPFRTSPDPPPKFNPVHVWGMMKWGKKAGAWGQGVDGLKGKSEETEPESKS